MSPEERNLLAGLFDRVRSQAATPRDGEAEAFIADAVRAQPYAPYLLAQSVIVQEAALRAANERLQQLEAQVQSLQQSQQPPQPAGGGSFLGSLFGGGNPPPPPPRSAVPPGGPWQQPQQAYAQPQPYPPQAPQPGPWGGAMAAPAGGGGGFLKGALGAAAGVAGGVLLADSIRGLFGGHNNPFGMGTGFADVGGGLGGGLGGGMGGETVINNYYENDGGTGSDPVQDAGYDTDSGTDFGGSDDSGGTYDV